MLYPVRVATLLILGAGLAPCSPASVAQDDAPGQLPQAEAPLGEAPELLQRIAVIGASASAGFELKGEVGAYTSLADALDLMVRGTHAAPYNGASSMLFMNPTSTAEKRVGAALAGDPTLVVAVDFLFWFSYGRVASEEDRDDLLTEGLAFLERFECPVIVGDIPDMSPAIGKMLARSQVPAPQTRAQLNERLRAWVAERERMHLVSLDAFIERLRADEELKVRGNLVPGGSTRALLQRDELHPTLKGLAALAILCMDAVAGEDEELGPRALVWDIEALAAAIYDSKEEQRQKEAQRAREREERRQAREGQTSGG